MTDLTARSLTKTHRPGRTGSCHAFSIPQAATRRTSGPSFSRYAPFGLLRSFKPAGQQHHNPRSLLGIHGLNAHPSCAVQFNLLFPYS